MPGFIGVQEIVVLVVVGFLVFGAKRLPDVGRSLGRGMREFKHGVTGKHERPQAEIPPTTQRT
ncbi:MAG: twin-arginine translocase TatA/TatE family subunit [Actinobacteria bacterium]|nr:MAG: twin-arginine translocase TatA/TatE family subunit [Actinomycetota bacterium]